MTPQPHAGKSISFDEYLTGVRAAWNIGIITVRDAMPFGPEDSSFEAMLAENYFSAKSDTDLLVNPETLTQEVEVNMDLAFDSSCYSDNVTVKAKLTELTDEFITKEAKEFMDQNSNGSTFEPFGGYTNPRIITAYIAADEHLEQAVVEDVLDDAGIRIAEDVSLDDEIEPTMVHIPGRASFFVLDGKIELTLSKQGQEDGETYNLFEQSCHLIARANNCALNTIEHPIPLESYPKESHELICEAVAQELNLIAKDEPTETQNPSY